jgi:YjbR
MSLPGTSEEPHFDMTSFRVHGKIFATAPADESRLHIFIDDSEVAGHVVELPGALEPLLWGQRVRGLRVLLAAAPDDRVRELLTDAWRRKAGKRMVAQFDAASRRMP